MEKYDVFPDTGFLPQEFPLERLPQAYYQPWEDLVNNLPALILAKKIRPLIDQMPKLDTSQLANEREYRRAYQVLGFLTHAYIWGVNEPRDTLPAQVAEPMLAVADHLRLPPLATYASLCLWNFKPIMKTGANLWDLDNLTTINTFTGSIDESWFYLVSIFFEMKGSFAIKAGMAAIEGTQQDNPAKVQTSLENLAESIDALGSVMMRMEEMCDPHVFYFRIRPYFAGWKNMGDAGLTKGGIFYEPESTPRAYAGGSNAQSSLIQLFDILLGVKHYSTGERPMPTSQEASSTEGPENAFMDEMKTYMPGKHQDFLQKVQQDAKIRDYVFAHKDSHPALVLSYDACLAMLKSFRDKHIQIVTRYIVLQAKSSAKMGSSMTLRSGLAKSKKSGAEAKGTGGTALLPFLKQCRDETGAPAAGDWGKRILSDGVMRLRFAKSNAINEE
ncbi:Indoleamine 23-dioxygenase [Meyerozyma sp. JA9]|nr:Indoleamine 23-dioxygenase [Meyerozyma sp. JA9]